VRIGKRPQGDDAALLQARYALHLPAARPLRGHGSQGVSLSNTRRGDARRAARVGEGRMSALVSDARVRVVDGFDPFDEPIVALLIKRAYRFAPGVGVVEAVEPGPWVAEQVDERCGDR